MVSAMAKIAIRLRRRGNKQLHVFTFRQIQENVIHQSTSMAIPNNTNYETYLFWWKLGAKRVVSARELSLVEIKGIREKIPAEMEMTRKHTATLFSRVVQQLVKHRFLQHLTLDSMI